jgi:hypothetical protein
MQPSRFRPRDAAVVAAFLALLLVAGRLNGRSLQSGDPAPDRAVPSPAAAQAPSRALPGTLPVAARILLPGRSGLLQGGLEDERAVAAASGAVWVADGCAVARVHPRTNRITGRVAIAEADPRDDACRVLGLSISPDGSVWVATTTVLVRIDRAGRRITARLPLAPSGAPAAATDAMWVPCCRVVESDHASLPLTGWLLRVDPGTDRVTARIPLAGGHPKAVGAGQGGIWVAGYRDRQDRPGDVIEHAPVLWRVDPATNQVVSSFSPPGSPAALLASDASPPSVLASHGAVFMSDPSTGVVWQVDPHQQRFLGNVAISQGGPLTATTGDVWAGGANSLVPLTGPNAGGDGLRLLDPLGRWITGLAAGADTLWVATSDALYRIDRRRLRSSRVGEPPTTRIHTREEAATLPKEALLLGLPRTTTVQRRHMTHRRL